MKFKKYLITMSSLLILIGYLPVVYAEEVSNSVNNETVENLSESSKDNIVNNYNTDSYNQYYTYHYENVSKYDDVDLVSLNNQDEGAYWRPKYDELSLPLKEYITTKDKNVQVKTNAFDTNWSTVDKSNVDTSRALEKLGYDFMLYKETVTNSQGNVWDKKVENYSYSVDREVGYSKPITAPYFIMNVYKALGINLYDVYIQYKENSPEVGSYITRTDPKSYWKLFLNDHPIDYEIYDDNNVSDITAGRVLSTSDAITILAQMLDFYGEPIISKQEEYLLLQVYGKDVPTTLTDTQKVAWSYLKSRGIIPEKELDYDKNLSFNDMMDLLMRSSDKASRTNFKEIQITTTLDDSFIQNGYYEADVVINNKPSIVPTKSSISFNNASRYDFLIEMTEESSFRFKDTQKLNKSLFISKGPLSADKPVNGSVYHGIVNGRYYHFSVPVSELYNISTLYVNSSNSEDYPSNYHIPVSDKIIGGVYSKHKEVDSEDSITYLNPDTFESTYPETLFVDADRRLYNSTKKASAASIDLVVNYTFSTELIDITASIKAIKKLGGTATLSSDKKSLNVSVSSSAINVSSTSSIKVSASEVANRLVIKDEYIYKSTNTTAILGLTGDRLLIPLDEAKSLNMVNSYKVIPEEDTIIIYTKDKDIVIVNNKSKIIQKGNTYLQVKQGPSLFTQIDGKYSVDFRALYGSKEFGFTTEPDPTTGKLIVNFYNNNLIKGSSTTTAYRLSSYSYFPTNQYLPYNISSNILTTKPLDLLYKLKPNLVANKGDEVTEVLMPFSSSNILGNYIIYGEYDEDTGYEKYYLITITPTGVFKSKLTPSGDYKSMFLYHPTDIKNTEYTVDVLELNSTSESKYGIKQVPGIGWVYSIKKIDNTQEARKKFMLEYRNHTRTLPFAISYNGRTPMLYNFNINYFNDYMTENLVEPITSKTYTGVIPAVVSIQSWFTNPVFVPHISKGAVIGKTNDNQMPLMYFGTLPVKVNSKSKVLSTTIGGLNVGDYIGITLTGMNSLERSGSTYTNPGIYYITATDLDVTLSTTKDVVEETEIDRRTASLQEFFDKYEDITFMDFIHGVDNGMSILYYIITRVVPLIIMCLLTIMLMISMMADIRIVQMFCTNVFDPVKFLTFGNHNIMTVRNKYFVLSLIGALTLMGIIQAGNLEKIIMFFIRLYYAIMMFFE